MAYKDRILPNSDPQSKCNTVEDFQQWCIDGGWEGIEDFESSTGVPFEELKGKWFTVVHNRVFIDEK